jgi:hypothetical protein
LRNRWSGWNREPLTSESRSHISVWQKPAGVARTPAVDDGGPDERLRVSSLDIASDVEQKAVVDTEDLSERGRVRTP